VMPAQDMFWGDRYGIVADPFGHKWSFATHLKDLTPAQMQAAMKDCVAK
jgi:PhnB protein